MLLQVSLTNFFSLKDQAILDMRASNVRIFSNAETRENVFTEDGISILKSVAIFGANASGKSNFLKAIEVCLRYIQNSHNFTAQTIPQFEPFKFNDNDIPSSVDMEFIIDGERYEYGFSILSNRVVKEYLYSYPKRYRALVFKREVNDAGIQTSTFSKKFTRPKEVETNTSQYSLFLTRAALLNRPEPVKILSYITSRFVIGLPSFEDAAFEALLQSHKTTILDALKYADSDIVDYEFKTSVGASTTKKLVTYHKNNPSKGFNFECEESAGTRRLLRLIAAFIDVAENGKILLIDELETSLHPQLVKYAVKTFNRSSKAQLIFSTHNLELLDVEVLRPDQIYFVSKDYNNGASEIYSLADYADYKTYKHLRRDYEQGRFDAIPILPTV